ncbi:hypothetical protein G7Y89_g7249 [Cudoniella acicularis]|uniref:AB hydrolase-1 domain-containing protein n=1 Tax=Cudoniella acicularis TaxID=354080 RepID=A0A8H4W404_9HELO|nr:hypothetical protein G7Y89_g7249 [Cudoniella acicularis]
MSNPIKKAYFDAPEGQIHYRYVSGSGEEKELPCVFLHMSADSSGHFEKMLKLYAARGYDCYAPDIPGFGGSYDPEVDPPSTTYYVEAYSHFLKFLNLSKFHLLGHHSGACLSGEIAVKCPSLVASVTLAGPTIMTRQDQLYFLELLNPSVPFNKPVSNGSHLLKTWNFLKGIPGLGKDGVIYNCVFNHDFWGYFEKIGVSILALCARDDILWDYFCRVNKVVYPIPHDKNIRCCSLLHILGVSLSSWTIGSSLIGYDLTAGQACGAVLVRTAIASLSAFLTGTPGTVHHLGYGILGRAAFGLWGSYFCVMMNVF